MAKESCAKVRIRREKEDGLVHLQCDGEDVALTDMRRRYVFESGATVGVRVMRRRNRLTAFIDAGDQVELVAPNGNSSLMWFRVEFSFEQGRMSGVKIVPGPKDVDSRERFKRFNDFIREEAANLGFMDTEYRTAL